MTVHAMSTAQPQVVTFGETMAVLSSPPGLGLRMAETLRLSIAGAESNVAIGLARMGVPTAWFGRVGDDELGRLILARLAAEGVQLCGAVMDADAPTALMFKERRHSSFSRVTYYRRDSAGSRLRPQDVPTPTVASARHLHFSGITPALSPTASDTVHTALALARDAGLTISMDINFRRALWPEGTAADALTGLARRVDIIFATIEEAELITSGARPACKAQPPPEALCHALAALGPSEVVLKLGARGAISIVDGSLERTSAEAVAVVDPVGAGDAFVCGYLAAHLENESPLQRLRTGTIAAAFALGAEGDWEGLPSRRELAEWTVADPVHR